MPRVCVRLATRSRRREYDVRERQHPFSIPLGCTRIYYSPGIKKDIFSLDAMPLLSYSRAGVRSAGICDACRLACSTASSDILESGHSPAQSLDGNRGAQKPTAKLTIRENLCFAIRNRCHLAKTCFLSSSCSSVTACQGESESSNPSR